MASFISADTGVISRLTVRSQDSDAYNGWIAAHLLAISFQVKAELLGCNFNESRMGRLRTLVASCVELEHSSATNVWYARIAERRRELQRVHHDGGNAGDGDVWVISSALEHGLALLGHDRALVELARAMGANVYTNLPDLRLANPKID